MKIQGRTGEFENGFLVDIQNEVLFRWIKLQGFKFQSALLMNSFLLFLQVFSVGKIE